MDDNTFAGTLGKSTALTKSTVDLDSDLLLIIDASAKTGRAKFKKITPRQLLGGAISALRIPLLTCKTATGLSLTASAGAGVFGVTLTPGTSEVLTGEVASSNTKTDKVVAEITLPANYVAGSAFNVVVNAKQTGTATVKTIDASLWKSADDGTQGADLVTTNAQAITTAAADYTFAVDGTTLSPGDRVMLQLTSVTTEAAAGNTNAAINSIRATF